MTLLRALSSAVLSTTLAVGSTACSVGARPPEAPTHTGSTHVILQSVHLGDNLADGQAFGAGASSGARACALVSVPSGGAEITVRVQGLRSTEVLSDVLTINGRRYPLGITLERGATPWTSNATVGAPAFSDRLVAGGNQLCLVAGARSSGDLDDFEVEQVLVDVHGVPAGQVSVNVLAPEGTPGIGAPPSLPWGAVQGWPTGGGHPTAWGWGR
ncbi:MAG: hypothetical protein IT374_23395 [Polyangiaceae bacterium]|nr:hypothetical protein [Polyangiaceae bacterium]